jgi:ATP-dependent Clp protease ATP-binding subunit ClpB
MPIELDNISREIMRAEIEVEALKKDDDKVSKLKIESLQKEIAIKKDEFNKLSAKWKGERMTIDSINELKEEIDNVTHEISVEERNYNLEKVAELKYGRLPELERKLSEAVEKQESQEKSESLLREKITDEEIANIVSKWTGIPLSKLIQGEREKLINLENILHKKVIGQDEAVTKVSDAIIRSRAGIKDPEKPIGTFIFLGPTGVGKTELAKALSETLFVSDKNLIRIDMSEYMERHSVSKLIGAPPGYVGYEQGGQLTELVRRKPYSVILFDEIEKAHPEVFNVLLQVLDDGRITDSKGRTVDFKNTIIILTSNIGSEDLTGGMYNGRLLEASREKVMTKLKASFKPEFLNRIDDIVLYKPLSKEDLVKILDIQLKELSARLENMNLQVTLTDKAKEHLVEVGYDPVYGARPLKRVIQRELENLLGKAIISGQILEGDDVEVDYDGVKLIVKNLEEFNINK